MLLRLWIFAAIVAGGTASLAARPATPPVLAYSYADLADLAVAAPVAAHVRVTDAIALKPAAGASSGHVTYYVEVQVLSLIRGPQDFPAAIAYLAELPNAADASARIRSKSEYLILASPVAGRPGEIQLIDKDAQIPWSSAAEARLRSLLREASAPGAAPRITGVGKGFHVAGTLPGESETQLFLNTANGQPISLSILRRPGQEPHWSVALGEIVDEAAAPPPADSLLWYRLACGLPRTLPPATLAESGPQDAAAIAADYALVLQRLGPCRRIRGVPARPVVSR